tara:strand:+ start:221 stop:334 length:114 start_codon:yes stop_codon:yes gene_type:complete
MPKVKGKKYPYTAAGKKSAAAARKTSGSRPSRKAAKR